MRKSSVRGIAVSPFRTLEIKKPPSLAVSGILLGLVLLLREPAATPPPSGWNG
jgi:hypothetical protein